MLMCQITPTTSIVAENIDSVVVQKETLDGRSTEVSQITMRNGHIFHGIKGNWTQIILRAKKLGALWTNRVYVEQRS